MRQETITIYRFNELPGEKAKERARDWWRESSAGDVWWENVYEDFQTVLRILGVNADVTETLPGGKTRKRLGVYFSGFSSQGDGACVTGRYSYAKGSVKAMKAHAPDDNELQKIASDLYDLQRKNSYKVEAWLSHGGHYYHEHSISFYVEVNEQQASMAISDELSEIFRRLMRWMYRTLETEHDYLNSDECVDDCLTNNEYEFTEEGKFYV